MAKKKKPPQKYTRQEAYAKARSLGYTREQATKMRSWGAEHFDTEVKKKEKNIKRNAKLAERREKLKQAGYNSKQIREYQYRSQRFIDDITSPRRFGDDYMVIGYKEITDYATGEEIYIVKNQLTKVSSKSMVEDILAYMNNGGDQGYIGSYEILTTDNLNESMRFLNAQGYEIAYRGKGLNYTKLVAQIRMFMGLLYTELQRLTFVMDVIENLYKLNNPTAHQNADRLKKEILNHIYNENEGGLHIGRF